MSRIAAMRIPDLISNAGGASAVEFAFIAPILIMLVLGIAKFGLVLNNYLTLTEAVATGARNLALSRTTSTTPYTSTITQVQSAAVNLASGSMAITTTINGAACNNNTTCQTALTTAGTGGAATVRATYPCDLEIFGYNFAPGCTLSSSTTDMIQ
jgi:Flp pilus assembly protein TadG